MVGILALLLSLNSYAQESGSIIGQVFSQTDSLPLPMAQIAIKAEQYNIGCVADVEGNFRLRPVPPGTYNIEISFVGFGTKIVTGVAVVGNEIKTLGKLYLMEGILLGETVIDGGVYIPILDITGGSGTKITPKTLDKLPTKGDLNMVLKYIGSEFYVNERDNSVHFRGSRDNTSAFYIDGVRVSDLGTLPGFAIGSMQIFGGGIPAMYGDFTGGVVVVETKSYNDGKQERESLERYLEETKAPKYMTEDEYEAWKKARNGEENNKATTEESAGEEKKEEQK